jgi:hypothetical protein
VLAIGVIWLGGFLSRADLGTRSRSQSWLATVQTGNDIAGVVSRPQLTAWAGPCQDGDSTWRDAKDDVPLGQLSPNVLPCDVAVVWVGGLFTAGVVEATIEADRPVRLFDPKVRPP